MFYLDESFVSKYSDITAPFGFNGLGELVYMRTYSRLKPDGNNEKWFETVRRVVEGTYSLQMNHIESLKLGWNPEQAQASAQEMYDRMFNMKFLPPGRGLWSMGSDIIKKKGLAASLNNCGFVSTNTIHENLSEPFTFTMDMSMLGVGIGFDTKGAGKVTLSAPKSEMTKVFVEDTREGWVQSLKVLINAFGGSDGVNPEFDYSQIRKVGVPLKTFGGVSSGPQPLIELHAKVREVLNKNVGTPITITTIVDVMNLIGKCVVSGNLRRCLPEGTLIHTKNGLIPIEKIEPGTMVYTSSGLEETCELVHQGEQEVITIRTELGEFECTERHQIAVVSGIEYTWKCARDLQENDQLVFPIHEVEGQETYFSTHEVDVQIAKFLGYMYGNEICLTDLQLNLIQSIKKLELNFSFEFGLEFGLKIGLGEPSFLQCITKVPECILTGTSDIRRAYIEGFSINAKKQKYSKTIQCLYASLGIPTDEYLNVLPKEECGNFFPIKFKEILRTGKVCNTYDIAVPNAKEFIAAEGLLVHNTALISFGEKDSSEFMDLKDYSKNPQRMEYGWTSNNSIFAELGMDYTEVSKRICINGEPGLAWLDNMRKYSRMCDPPDNKDYRVMGGNPCLEQSLESMENCTLSECFLNRADSLEDFQRTIKFSYLYAKTVTLALTHYEKTNRVMLRNRRIGCSVSGVAQFLGKYDLHTLNKWLDKGYHTVQDWDRVYSEWFCIPRSIKTTSVKPSGTVSLLAGATPGMHYPESRFYIRRMRLSNISPLVQGLSDAGYHLEPAVGSEDTTLVVEIPIDVGEGIRTVNEVSMWEQVALCANMQRWWADNQVSCTVTFNPKTEGHQIAHALEHFQYHLKGISFLPKCDYGAFPQMPYEEITEEKFHGLCKGIKSLTLKNNEDSVGEKFCDGDSCIRN